MTTPSRWPNFHVWRGRLPHWRADGVTYYVTFRHRRPLDPVERETLFRSLLRPEGRGWHIAVLCVLQEQTDLIASPAEGEPGADRLTNIVERAKTRAGKLIVKRTGEPHSPFYGESYDRIVRSEEEREAFLLQILARPVDLGLVDGPDGYPTLWVGAV